MSNEIEYLLRLPEVLKRTGHSESGWYREMALRPELRPLKRGRQSLWPSTKIDAYVQEEIDRLTNPQPKRKAG